VALVTDGRMSGASGKVPAAIHLTPEAEAGGPVTRLRDGDMINLDARRGLLEVELGSAELAARDCAAAPDVDGDADLGCGRDLFALFRRTVGRADAGASVLA
jgi:phosphogluconate dehydratase